MFYKKKCISKIYWSIFVFSLISCDGPSKKITSYVKPLRVIKSNYSHSLLSTDVNFLFVLDASDSMHNHYAAMAKNFKHFLPLIKEHSYYNFNFAVTTLKHQKTYEENPEIKPLFLTDETYLSNCLIDYKPFIQTTPLGSYFHYESSAFRHYDFDDLMCLIAQNISNLPDEDGTEYYFESLNYLLDWNVSNEFHSKFFNPNNFLIIIFISDAIGAHLASAYEVHNNDISENKRKVNKEFIIRGKEQLQKIVNRRGGGNVKIYAITPPQEDDFCGERAKEGLYPIHVESLVQETKGKSFSICEKDWGKKLNIISKDLIRHVSRREVFLDEVPLLDTIEVYFNDKKIPQDIEQGWYYNPEQVAIYIGDKFDMHQYLKTSNDNIYTIKYHPLNLEMLYEK